MLYHIDREKAFANCYSLKEAPIRSGVHDIGNCAFENCSAITKAILPTSLVSIGSNAFNGCSSMTEAVIREKITKMGDYAFGGCSALMKLSSWSTTPPAITDKTFDGVDKQACVLTVPTGCKTIYWLNPHWEDFFNITEADYANGIASTTAAPLSIHVEGHKIMVENARSAIKVYDTGGILTAEKDPAVNTVITVPAEGIYVVAVDGKKIKVVVR